jgi:hypothetical protein
MVALMIACSHIPPLRPFAVLLSREGLPDTEAHRPRTVSQTEPVAPATTTAPDAPRTRRAPAPSAPPLPKTAPEATPGE